MTTDGSALTPTAAPPMDADRARPVAVSPLELVGVVALVALGAYTRAHGFTNLDLWFDDAWAAMPARVGLSDAVHMVLTAPGYGLAMRSWIRLDPATTWWAQLPAYVLGLARDPRRLRAGPLALRNPRWVAFGAAIVVTVSPLAVQYATRVKEYPFDLLAACALLALAERVRRAPRGDASPSSRSPRSSRSSSRRGARRSRRRVARPRRRAPSATEALAPARSSPRSRRRPRASSRVGGVPPHAAGRAHDELATARLPRRLPVACRAPSAASRSSSAASCTRRSPTRSRSPSSRGARRPRRWAPSSAVAVLAVAIVRAGRRLDPAAHGRARARRRR